MLGHTTAFDQRLPRARPVQEKPAQRVDEPVHVLGRRAEPDADPQRALRPGTRQQVPHRAVRAEQPVPHADAVLGGQRAREQSRVASLPSIDETENAIAPAYFTYHLKSGMFTAGTFDTPFEDGIFPAPLEYDWYLTATYGDWRTPPAPEDRGSTHHFEVYWR